MNHLFYKTSIILTLCLGLLLTSCKDTRHPIWQPSAKISKTVATELQTLNTQLQRHLQYLSDLTLNSGQTDDMQACQALARSEYFHDAFDLQPEKIKGHLVAQIKRQGVPKAAVQFNSIYPWLDSAALQNIATQLEKYRNASDMIDSFEIEAVFAGQICALLDDAKLSEQQHRLDHTLAVQLLQLGKASKQWLGISLEPLNAVIELNEKERATLAQKTTCINALRKNNANTESVCSQYLPTLTKLTQSELDARLYALYNSHTRMRHQTGLAISDELTSLQTPLKQLLTHLNAPATQGNFMQLLATITQQANKTAQLYQLTATDRITCNDKTNTSCKLLLASNENNSVKLLGRLTGNRNLTQTTGAAVKALVEVSYDSQNKQWQWRKNMPFELQISALDDAGFAHYLTAKTDKLEERTPAYQTRTWPLGLRSPSVQVNLVASNGVPSLVVTKNALQNAHWQTRESEMTDTLHELGIPKYMGLAFKGVDWQNGFGLSLELTAEIISNNSSNTTITLSDRQTLPQLRQRVAKKSQTALLKIIAKTNQALTKGGNAQLSSPTPLPNANLTNIGLHTLHPLKLNYHFSDKSSGIAFSAQGKLGDASQLQLQYITPDAEQFKYILANNLDGSKTKTSTKNIIMAQQTLQQSLKKDILKNADIRSTDTQIAIEAMLNKKIHDNSTIDTLLIDSQIIKSLVQQIPKYSQQSLALITTETLRGKIKEANKHLKDVISKQIVLTSQLPNELKNSDIDTYIAIAQEAATKQAWLQVQGESVDKTFSTASQVIHNQLRSHFPLLRQAVEGISADKQIVKRQVIETALLHFLRRDSNRKLLINASAAAKDILKNLGLTGHSLLAINDSIVNHCARYNCDNTAALSEQVIDGLLRKSQTQLSQTLKQNVWQWLDKPGQIPKELSKVVTGALQKATAISELQHQKMQTGLDKYHQQQQQIEAQIRSLPQTLKIDKLNAQIDAATGQARFTIKLSEQQHRSGIHIDFEQSLSDTIELGNTEQLKEKLQQFQQIDRLVEDLQKNDFKRQVLSSLTSSTPVKAFCYRYFNHNRELCNQPELAFALDAYAKPLAKQALQVTQLEFQQQVNSWQPKKLLESIAKYQRPKATEVCKDLHLVEPPTQQDSVLQSLAKTIPNIEAHRRFADCVGKYLQTAYWQQFKSHLDTFDLSCSDPASCRQQLNNRFAQQLNDFTAQQLPYIKHTRKALLQALGLPAAEDDIKAVLQWAEQMRTFTDESLRKLPAVAIKVGQQICVDQIETLGYEGDLSTLCQNPGNIGKLKDDYIDATKQLVKAQADKVRGEMETQFKAQLAKAGIDYNNGNPQVCHNDGFCISLNDLKDPKALYQNLSYDLKKQRKEFVNEQSKALQAQAKQGLETFKEDLVLQTKQICAKIRDSAVSFLGLPLTIDQRCPPRSANITASFVLFNENFTIRSGLEMKADKSGLKLNLKKLVVDPRIEAVLADKLEQQFDGLTVSNERFNEHAFSADISYQAGALPFPLEASVTIADLGETFTIDVASDLKPLLFNAMITSLCGFLEKKAKTIDFIPNTSITNFNIESCKANKNLKDFALDFTLKTDSELFSVILQVQVSTSGIKVGPPDLGNLLSALTQQWPFKFIVPDSPFYSLDGGVELYLIADIRPALLDLSVKAAFTLGKQVSFRGPITLQVPGWYDVPPVSFGDLGTSFDMEKRQIGFNAALTMTPGAATAKFIKISGQGLIGLKDKTFELNGELMLANLLSVASSTVLVDVPQRLFKTTITTTPMLSDLIAINGELRIQDKAPAPYVYANGKGELFGAKLASASAQLTMSRLLEADFSVEVDTPLSKQLLTVESDQKLGNPQFGFSVERGVKGLTKVAIDVAGNHKQVAVTGEAEIFGLNGKLRFTTSSINGVTPQRIFDELLAFEALGLPTDFDFDLFNSLRKSTEAKDGETGNPVSNIPPGAKKVAKRQPLPPPSLTEGAWDDAWVEVTKYRERCVDKFKPLGGLLGQTCEDIPYQVNEYMPTPGNVAAILFGRLAGSPSVTRNRLGMLKIQSKLVFAAFFNGSENQLVIYDRASLNQLWQGSFNGFNLPRGPNVRNKRKEQTNSPTKQAINFNVYSISPPIALSNSNARLLTFSAASNTKIHIAKGNDNLDQVITNKGQALHTSTAKRITAGFELSKYSMPFADLVALELIKYAKNIETQVSSIPDVVCLKRDQHQYISTFNRPALHLIKSSSSEFNCDKLINKHLDQFLKIRKKHCTVLPVSFKNTCGTLLKSDENQMVAIYPNNEENTNAQFKSYWLKQGTPFIATDLYASPKPFDMKKFTRTAKNNRWFEVLVTVRSNDIKRIESVQLMGSETPAYGMIYYNNDKRRLRFVDAKLNCQNDANLAVLNSDWQSIQNYWDDDMKRLFIPVNSSEHNDLNQHDGGFNYLDTLLNNNWQTRGWRANPRAALETDGCR